MGRRDRNLRLSPTMRTLQKTLRATAIEKEIRAARAGLETDPEPVLATPDVRERKQRVAKAAGRQAASSTRGFPRG